MNLCFLIGKIISQIEFKFIINSKRNSIVIFEIVLNNGSTIKVKGYDEIADYCFSQLKPKDIVEIYGALNTNGEIEIEEIIKFTSR